MPGVDLKHEFRCSECGYGAVARIAPEQCPMCRSTTWEFAHWRPFSRGLMSTTTSRRKVAAVGSGS